MAPIKITFSDHNATPPVYVAGSFTNWQPVEIEAKQGEDGFTYEKIFDLTPGTHQYKFRLGPGDWWVCDNQAQKTADASGNENNEIVVKEDPVVVKSDPIATAKPEVKSEPIAIAEPEVKSDPIAKAEPEVKPVRAPTSLISSATTVMNGTPELKTTNYSQPTKPVTAPAVKPSETLETPEPKVNGSAKAVVEDTKPEQIAEKETVVVQTAPEPAKAISQPLNEKVASEAIPPPAAKESDSKDSSVSSMPPKEKVSGEKVNEPKKLSWFSRIFLCGSSGK